MADLDLPVWSIPPNWSTPVTERLAWLTDVMTSRSLAEQRRAVRLTPRRYFDFKINPIGRVRSFFDQWMHRISDEACLLPLWHDKGKLTALAESGDERIALDTRWMEFYEGGIVLLYRDAFTFEAVEIAGIDDTGIDLAAGLDSDWVKGSTVYPVRRALLDVNTRTLNKTATVGDASLGFMVDQANDYDPGAEVLVTYDGYPIVSLEPNRLDDLELQYNRIMEELDNSTGRVRRYDENLRGYQTQFYNWTARGRQQHHELRQTLYRLRGRQKGVWMPSFNQDVVLSANLAPGQGSMDIEKIGYGALGGVIEGRDRVRLKDSNGTYRVVQIDAVNAAPSTDEERLSLAVNSVFTANAGTYASFLELVRMDQDDVEIVHHTDSMGVCEASAAFRSFSRLGAPPAIVYLPQPTVEMSDEACGDGALAPCYTPIQHYDGWDYEISARQTWDIWAGGVGDLYIFNPPGGSGGSALGGIYGSDYMTLFGPGTPNNTGNQVWSARRVNMGDPENPASLEGVGNWNAYLDIGINNYFGTPPESLNHANIYVYMRHWTEPFPGHLVGSLENYTGNGDFIVDIDQTIDWREYR